MSAISKAGRTSRMVMVAAVFAVALMIAVPVISAVGTDAAFTKDEAGYYISLTDPTDEQLSKVNINKDTTLLNALWGSNFFDDAVVGEPTIAVQSYSYSKALGQRISSDEVEMITSEDVTGKGFSMTFTAIDDGDLVLLDSPSQKMIAACKAINDYVGEVKKDDKITVTGNLKEESATVDVSEYLLQDDGTCVPSKIRHSSYVKADTDVTISVSRGDALLKSFRFVSDIKGTATEEATIEYSEMPVKIGTGFTKTYKTTTSYGGDICFKVNGTDYSVLNPDDSKSTQHGTVTHLYSQSEMFISAFMKESINGLPDSEEGMKVDKTYSAAESAVDNVVTDVSGRDSPNMAVITGAVVIVILILLVAIAAVIVVRKKKNQ